ncbi:MAG: hypothetical protein DWI22_01310 [Planctomycetota bacterium]|nr:MAG: hypothetical protein DWI22_01310 [Planctomycetota bacterium]
MSARTMIILVGRGFPTGPRGLLIDSIHQPPVARPMALAFFDQPARASVRFMQDYLENRVLAHRG